MDDFLSMLPFVLVGMAANKRGIEAGRAYVKAWLDDSMVSRGLKRMQAGIRGVTGALASVGTKLVGAGVGLGGLFAMPLKRSAMLQTMRADLAALLKSTEKAEKVIGDFRKFAKDTPLEFLDVQEMGTQILNWKLGDENSVVDVLRAVGDAAGGVPDRMRSVIRALGQMRATGRIQADEMNQLTEAGLPAWELLAKVLGTDVKTAMEAVHDKAVDATVAVPALLAALGEFGNGRMSAMAKTLTGRVAALKDSLWEAVTPLGDALLPYAERFTAVAATATDRIGRWMKANAVAGAKVAATAAVMVVLGSVMVAASVAIRGATYVVTGLAMVLRAVLLPATLAVTAATRIASATAMVASATIRGLAAAAVAVAGSLNAAAMAASMLSKAVLIAELAVKFFRSTAIGLQVTLAATAIAVTGFEWAVRSARVAVLLFGGSLRVLAGTLAVVSGVFAVLGSPIGAAVLVLSALGVAIYSAAQSGVTFSDVLNRIATTLGPLAARAREVFGIVHDALMSGQMAAAADVMWASIRLAFANGIDWLKGAWIDLRESLAGTFIDLGAKIESVWAKITAKIVQGLTYATAKAIGLTARVASQLGLHGQAAKLGMISSGLSATSSAQSGAKEQAAIEKRRRETRETLAEDAARERKGIGSEAVKAEQDLQKSMDRARSATKRAKEATEPEIPAAGEIPTVPLTDGAEKAKKKAKRSAIDAVNTAAVVGSESGAEALAKAMGQAPSKDKTWEAVEKQTRLMERQHREALRRGIVVGRINT